MYLFHLIGKKLEILRKVLKKMNYKKAKSAEKGEK